MSDKIETKNKDNLARVDFKNKEKIVFPNDFISKAEVHSILSNNFGKISDNWFKFVFAWNYNAYKTFHDMDKYLILIFLIQKSFKHYSETYRVFSEEEFYSTREFQIEKINLIEIADELLIPKETIRRKINELQDENIVLRGGKKIVIKPLAFTQQRPRHTIKQMSSFLSLCSKFLATETWFGEPIKSEDIEAFTRKYFTLVWRFFFRFKIPFLVRQRKFYGDLETFIVAGSVYINHVHRLKEKVRDNPIKVENSVNDYGEASYTKWMKFIVTTKEKIVGINASSIAEITGVPRATVIRKLKQIEKKNILVKDNKQLYTIGKHYKNNLKNLEAMMIENQIDLCKFVSIFFDLYKNNVLRELK